MEIAEPTALANVLNQRGDSQTLHLAHPPQQMMTSGAAASRATVTDADEQSTSDLVLIGPEGGFTDDEVQAAIDSGANCLSWPGHILRIETAAVMAAVWIRSRK
jgi:16S rRNA (uracil1498-N3)-methyltransferase